MHVWGFRLETNLKGILEISRTHGDPQHGIRGRDDLSNSIPSSVFPFVGKDGFNLLMKLGQILSVSLAVRMDFPSRAVFNQVVSAVAII